MTSQTVQASFATAVENLSALSVQQVEILLDKLSTTVPAQQHRVNTILNALAEHPFANARLSVAKHPVISKSPVTIEMLAMKDKEISVRCALAKNPAIGSSPAAMETLAKDLEVTVRIALAGNTAVSYSSATLETLAKDKEVSVRSIFAGNPAIRTSQVAMQTLAKDPVINVRVALEKNPESGAYLKKLTRDTTHTILSELGLGLE